MPIRRFQSEPRTEARPKPKGLGTPRPARSQLGRAIAVVLWLSHLAAADNPAAAHIRNFAEVSDHLYRGGQPTQRGLEELAALHVDLVIDLREPSQDTNLEQQMVEALKMKFINIPFRGYSAPTDDQMQRVLWLLVNGDSKRIFVHCWRGKDRTGTVVACYRIQHDGWDNRKALAEAQKYGMSFTERSMRSYILHFSPIGLSALTPPGK